MTLLPDATDFEKENAALIEELKEGMDLAIMSLTDTYDKLDPIVKQKTIDALRNTCLVQTEGKPTDFVFNKHHSGHQKTACAGFAIAVELGFRESIYGKDFRWTKPYDDYLMTYLWTDVTRFLKEHGITGEHIDAIVYWNDTEHLTFDEIAKKIDEHF